MKRSSALSALTLLAVWINLFAPLAHSQSAAQTDQPEDTQKGLIFTISETGGSPQPARVSHPKVEQLSSAETAAILRRLPVLTAAEKADRTDFKLAPSSLLPPKTGKIIPIDFKPEESQKPPAAPPPPANLELLQFAPAGEVNISSEVVLTFSQPMIEISSLAEANANIPAKISPEVPGAWRWAGTNTLIFKADPRLPGATEFTVTIPAGTKSATGGVMEKEITRKFNTAPLKPEILKLSGDTIKPDELFLATFNQRIKPPEILAKTRIAVNGRDFEVRPATEAEIAADREISEKIKDLREDYFLVFRSSENIPLDSTVEVYFEKDLPSAEGSLTTKMPFIALFKTYGSLKLTKAECGDNTFAVCDPRDQWELEFNNPIDSADFSDSLVKVEPPLEDLEISVSSDTVYIRGWKTSRTEFTVSVSENLRDIFGQTLGKTVSAKFKTGASEPTIYAEGKTVITLDPNAKPVYHVYSTNFQKLNIALYAVKPEDFRAIEAFSENKIASIGKLVYRKTVSVKAKKDEQAATTIDLSPALTKNLGHAVLTVDPVGGSSSDRIVKWLQATQIGVDALADRENLTAFVTGLRDGKPLADVELTLDGKTFTKTNAQGLTSLELPPAAAAKEEDEPTVSFLIARKGADAALLSNVNGYYYDNENWTSTGRKDNLRWFVFDDRKIYRPTETVSIKGYLRKVSGGKLAEIGSVGSLPPTINYVLKDSATAEILRGATKINSFGAFDLEIKTPENINLGTQELTFSSTGDFEDREFTHHFRVEEFRRPDFQVETQIDSAAPFYVGDTARLFAQAEYFSGGGLSGAPVEWNVVSKPTGYTPPNRDDFTFGKWYPWWTGDSRTDWEQENSRKFAGQTDRDGKHRITLDFISARPARPFSVQAKANVQDVNRQTFSGTTNLLVHPSRLYVGLRTAKTFVQQNQKFTVETITTDIDGKAVAGAPVSVKAELKDWKQIKGEWERVVIDTQTCDLKSKTTAAVCEFSAPKGGVYDITARVSDERNRPNESEISVWVAGGTRQAESETDEETLELIPDKKEYRPGETAEILVNAPFYPAEAVMTLDKNGIVKTERLTVDSASTVVKIPIEENYLPNFHVRIETVGAVPRIIYDDQRDAKMPKRPAFAAGSLQLNVSTASRQLSVTAEPVEKTLKPAEQTKINLSVSDQAGKPVADSEIALVAVDESILALTDYRIENPMAAFYKAIDETVSSTRSRETVVLARPDGIGFGYGVGYGYGSGMEGGMGGGGGGTSVYVDKSYTPPQVKPALPVVLKTQGGIKREEKEIRIRRNFAALAIFAPSVKTDRDGKATVELRLPDNLTRYRITAVAVDQARKFGFGESAVTARQPLTVRPSAPRFLNFGDQAEIPVVIQNQTDRPQTVSVAIRATNAHFPYGSGRKVTIPANDRAEIRFPVESEKAGTARFQIGAVGTDFADAAEFVLPVLTPATTEAFATYGTTDQNGAIIQPVSAPKDVYPQFGGLEITTSSTQLQELTDAFIYLQTYPFECTEQRASRVLSTVALRDVLRAFEAKDLPTDEEITAKMKSDVEQLEKLQHADGGFSFWRSDDESFPYVSVHVAHAFARLRQKGYAVSPSFVSKSLDYLRKIETDRIFKKHSQASQNAIAAYALYVRNLLGEKDAAKARKILTENAPEDLSVETLGWLLTALAGDAGSVSEIEMIKQNFVNRASVTADKAHFTTNYTDGEFVILSSERRADGIVLEALLESDAQNPLIPKIVRGLLASKIRGRWKNTQENALILLALDKYFRVYESQTPNFTTKIWLGNAYTGEQKFQGRSIDSNLLNVPMNYLQSQKDSQSLVLDKEGAGRIYYRIGMKYAPKNLNLTPTDAGFQVSRIYEAVDDPQDVKISSDGSWQVRSGARVRVIIQMVAPSVRYHVALVDHLPAGLEIINMNLANTSANTSEIKKSDHLKNYYGEWFDRQNLRDSQAEAFKTRLSAGIWTYTYLARATAPGEFTVPPAKAEEMYSPETFGRSKTDIVRIK